MKLLEYRLTSEALCLGERMKKRTYRNSITTIPYTQITGALRTAFATTVDEAYRIHAVGVIPPDGFKWGYHTYSLWDKALSSARVPLQVKALADVEAKVYVVANEFTTDTTHIPTDFWVRMGAMKSRGLGECRLSYCRTIEVSDQDRRRGWLATRIPLHALSAFGINFDEDVDKPIWGYLFKVDVEEIDGRQVFALDKGRWVQALFEGSFLRAPKQFLEKVERRLQ